METKLLRQSIRYEISPLFFVSFPRSERAIFFPRNLLPTEYTAPCLPVTYSDRNLFVCLMSKSRDAAKCSQCVRRVVLDCENKYLGKEQRGDHLAAPCYEDDDFLGADLLPAQYTAVGTSL